MNRGRMLGAARLAWAGLLLAAPAAAVRAAGGEVDAASTTVARILGVREAAQGAVEVAAWPRWRRTGQAVDLLHSLSMVGLGAVDRRWRRVVLTDAALAAGWAVAASRC